MKSKLYILAASVLLPSSPTFAQEERRSGDPQRAGREAGERVRGEGPRRGPGGERSRRDAGGARPTDLGATPMDLGAPGIAWYGRLEDGLAEAKRSNRPILFVSAASQCGGVPGVF